MAGNMAFARGEVRVYLCRTLLFLPVVYNAKGQPSLKLESDDVQQYCRCTLWYGKLRTVLYYTIG